MSAFASTWTNILIRPSPAPCARGIDITTTTEAGLRTRDDTAHLDFIRNKGRVMVTRDRDFLRLAAQSRQHPGIVFCTTYSIGEIVRGLMLIHEVLSPEELNGRVEYL